MTPSSGTFTPLTGATATSLSTTADDAISTSFPIGFNFAYGGVTYTSLRASSNGLLTFNATGTSTAANNLATTTAAARPALAPLWDDMACTVGVNYKLSGSAPNRTLTVEWLNMKWNYSATGPVISFQVILYETSNIIDFIYRQESVAYNAGFSGGASIGLVGVATTDYLSLQNSSATPTLSTSASTNNIGTKPASNQVYRFAPPPFPTLTFSSITPSTISCTSTGSRVVEVNASIASGSLTTVNLNYSFNGVAQTPIAMTNTSGSVYTATIPAATPVNAIVTWNVVATSSFTTTASYTGTSYQDQPLLGVTAMATTNLSTVCSGSASSLSAALNWNTLASTTAPTYTTPTVSSATADEDFGNVTISQGATVILNNTSTINSLTGTLGTATGTAGSYSNFTALGTYTLNAGQTYSISLSSLTTGPTNYTNYMAAFLDMNRDGAFTSNEAIFVSPAAGSGAHTVSGTFTIPSTAFNGLMRLRVFSYESSPSTTYYNSIGYGEFEDYLIDMVSTSVGGGSGTLPAITSVSWSDGTATVGTGNPLVVNPTVTTTYTGTVTAGGCQVTSSTITVNALPLPAAPVATNSTQCGTAVPGAFVTSAAGADGTGDYNWYDAATSGNLLQNSSWLTQYEDAFTGPTLSAGGVLSGVASLTALAGWLQLTPATNSQQGGLTVTPGVNGIQYKIDFDYKASTAYGADGFSWSFAPDADATIIGDGLTLPSSEMGTGSKLKISFDAYGTSGENIKGTYLLYNNTNPTFNSTSTGVLASTTATPWLSTSSTHITITISQTGLLSMTAGNVPVFTNIQLPADYLSSDKSTWKHVFAARTGGVNMTNQFDNLKIKYKLVPNGSTTFNSAVSTATTLYVSELGTNGCYSPLAPVVIGVSQPAPITYTNSASAICIGSPVTLNMSSTITPAYTYTITSPNAGAAVAANSTGASQTFTPTASGNIPYIVTAENGNCTEVDTVIISVVPGASPAPILAVDTLTICPSATSAAFTATPSSMMVPYTFNLLDSYGDGWNGNALKVLVNGTLVQTLTFTTGSSYSAVVNVPEGALLTTQWTTGSYLSECSFNIVYNGATIHTASGLTTANLASKMYSGTVPSYNYTFSWYSAATGGSLLGTGATLETIGTSVLPNLNTAGQYTVYVKQSNACMSAAAPAVVNVTNVLAEIIPVAATCNSVANGTFTLGTITCGTTPFTYSVDGGSFGPIPTNLAAGTHTVVIKDATGAVAPSISFVTTEPTWITNVPNFVANGWACKDETSEIISVANPNVSTSVTLSLQNNFAIPGSATVSFTAPVSLPVGATVTSATLQINGLTTTGLTYASDLNLSTSGFGNLTVTPTGNVVTNANYTYPLTGVNTANGTLTFNVQNTWSSPASIANVSLVVNYTINQTLDNITWYAAPTGGTSIGSGYTLQSVGTSVLPNTMTPGTYNFYAQGELNGCSSFTRRLVPVTIQAPTIVANMQTATVCPGQYLTLNATGGLSYSWSNGAGQNTPFVPAPVSYVAGTQSYVVNGFDIDGCANQDTVVVTIKPQPILNAGFDQTVCAGTPIILNASTTAQTATAVTSFVWSNGVTNNAQYVPTTSGTLTATANGANGCTTQDQVVVTVLALPVVNAGADQTICAGTGATLNATGAASYTWNNNVLQGITFYPTASQLYTVTGVGANGCTNVDQVQVNISTGPSVVMSAPQTVCSNGSAVFSAAPVNSLGGFWSTSGSGTFTPNITSSAVTYSPAANDPANVTLTYVATNACGSNSGTTTVNVLAIPVINAGPDQTVCSGSPAILNATGTGFITWLSPNIVNGIGFVPNASATYTAVATASNGCTNQDQVAVTVVALPDVDGGLDQTICAGESLVLSASGAITYQWNNGVVNGTSFAPTTTTTYTVTGTTVNGCSDTDNVTVFVNATPVAVATMVNDVTLEATTGAFNYQWINCTSGTDVPNASFATFNALANGTYAVIVTTPQGCSDQSDCITINAVGIQENVAVEMGVQPNPTTGELTITMPSDLKAKAQVLDAQGKLVIDQVNVSNGSILNLTNMTTGVYMVRISSESSIQTFRVVKQ